MAYGAFADIYDAFNEDADYAALTRYALHQMKAHGIHEGIVADLGCGTGDLTLALAQAGYDMIGIDLSEEMLCILREKKCMNRAGRASFLLQQDLRSLDLYGTVRAAVSTFDTLNHIGPYEQFERAPVPQRPVHRAGRRASVRYEYPLQAQGRAGKPYLLA